MKLLVAHWRFATMQENPRMVWGLDAEPDDELKQTSLPDWPVWAAAFASLTGVLGDLPDNAPDRELLDLLRRGWGLGAMGAITPEQLDDEYWLVMTDLQRTARYARKLADKTEARERAGI